MRMTLAEVYDLSLAALRGSGATAFQAEPTAESVREAEAEGIRNVGLGYLPIYCEHLRCGKVAGDADPVMAEVTPALLRVDARHGFAHPAFLRALPRFAEMAGAMGVAALSITHSYSAGVVGWFVARLAEEGLVSLAFANSSASIAPWGGRKAMFGTNPIGFGAPRRGHPPIVVDMASSATARVNIVQAAGRGEQVPPGWVFDREGKPTTDPKALLAGGSVGPLGGAKGYGLALIVDLLAAGLTGASFSYQASAFGNNQGGPPDVGQLFIALSPKLTGGEAMAGRLEELVAEVEAQPGARLPGDKRHESRRKAEAGGVEVPADLVAKLKGYAA